MSHLGMGRAAFVVLLGALVAGPLAADEEVTDGSAVLEGEVVDEAGRPLAGVGVEARSGDPARQMVGIAPTRALLDAVFEPPASASPDSPTARSATTDEHGRFRLTGLRADVGFLCRARPEPPAFGVSSRARTRREGTTFVRLHVEHGRTLRGRLVDTRGRSVRGWITATARPGRDVFLGAWGCDCERGSGAVATDETGRFRIAVPAEHRIQLDAFVPGSRLVTAAALVTDPSREVVLVDGCEDGGSVVGRVRDEEGRPVCGARVLLRAPEREPYGVRPTHDVLARTDALGAFALRDVPPADVTLLVVETPGHALWVRAPEGMRIAAGDVVRVDVTLVRAARLEVAVRDPDGKPVAGAKAEMLAWLPPQRSMVWPVEAVTDEDGVATFEDLPPGPGSLRIEAAGLCLPAASVQAPPGAAQGARTPDLAPGGTGRLGIRMEEARTLEGQVVDARGEPVTGATVELQLARADLQRGQGMTTLRGTTDEQGRFALGGTPPSFSLTVRVYGEGLPLVTTVVDPQATDADGAFQIVLPDWARVAGRVADVEGRPVAGIDVTCGAASDGAVTDAEGRFVLEAVTPGRWWIGLGRHIPEGAGRYVDLRPGQQLLDLVLRHEGRAAVEGSVTDADGRAEAGHAVLMRRPDHANVATAWTDERGRFRVERLPPGPCVVESRGASATIRIEETGTTNVRLVVPPPEPSFVLEGTVVGPAGDPVADASVSIRRPGDGAYVARWRAAVLAGRLRTRIPAAEGALVIRVHDARDAAGTPLDALPAQVERAAATEGPVAVCLERGATLRGRVVGEDGAPLPHVVVQATLDAGQEHSDRLREAPVGSVTDADGRFAIPGLYPCPYRLDVSPPASWIWLRGVSATPGPDEVEIRLPRWRTLVVDVLAPDGSPVPGANVATWRMKAEHLYNAQDRTADAVGRVVLDHLTSADRIALRVTPPDDAGAAGDLVPAVRTEIVPGDDHLTVRLETGLRLSGRVLSDDGTAVAGASVHLTDPDPRRIPEDLRPLLALDRKTQTDETGRYLFRGLAPGAVFALHVEGPVGDRAWHRESLRDVRPGEEPLDVILERFAFIEGRVEGVDASGLKGLRIDAHPLDRRLPSADVLFDGTRTSFRLGPLRKGAHELRLSGGRNLVLATPEGVEAPATGVVLQLRREGRLAGVVLGAEGDAFRVEFVTEDGVVARTTSDPDGLWRLGHLPPLVGTVVAYRQGDPRVALVRGVDTGREEPLVVALAPGKPIRGRVVGLPAPVVDGRVVAASGVVHFEGRVSEDGTFETPPLPAGPWTLSFRFLHPTEGSVPTPETVEAGTEDLVLEWSSAR